MPVFRRAQQKPKKEKGEKTFRLVIFLLLTDFFCFFFNHRSAFHFRLLKTSKTTLSFELIYKLANLRPKEYLLGPQTLKTNIFS